jgi:hypothetical protein
MVGARRSRQGTGTGKTTAINMLCGLLAPVQLEGGGSLDAGGDLPRALGGVRYPGGGPLLDVTAVADRAEAEAMLRDREAALLLIVPTGFSQDLTGAEATCQGR